MQECGFDPSAGKIPWRKKWQLTLLFFPGNPMDRGVWWATVHGVEKSWTQLSNLTIAAIIGRLDCFQGFYY